MKKAERKVLREKLLTAVNKVLTDNKDELKKKTIKAIDKAIKQIAKKTDKKEQVVIVKKGTAVKKIIVKPAGKKTK